MNFINGTDYITQEGGNNICNWALQKGEAITETGLKVVMESNPGVCNVEHKVIAIDLCCNMRCKCQIHLDEDEIIDLTSALPEKEVYYSCSRSEFEECEMDCRHAASEYLKDDRLNDTTVNYINVFANKDLADSLCQIVGGPVFHPGYDAKLVITTRPGELALYKEVLLGTICCERPCLCRFEDISGSQEVLDLSNRLPQKVYEFLNFYH